MALLSLHRFEMLCRTRNSADKLLLHFRFLSSAKISPLANFLQELSFRNMIGNTHPVLPYKEKDLKTYASTLPNVLYSGFDPTSNSFHIGNLLVLVTLIRSAIIGCNPIALIGEATVAVGDPSGHTSDRKQLSKEEIHENVSLLRQQLERIISNARSFNGEHFQFTILNNLDWHKEIKMLDFLASSKRYRMGEMLKTGPVRSRLENGLTLSFSEFAYQVLQSNDWLKLYETHDCLCQIGGSDQLGNLEIGFEHIRAKTGRLSLGICLPLLTDEDGNKLGKSTTEKAGTGFWLNPQRTSHFSFYQYFRQLHDDIAETLLLRFSLRPLGELEEVIKQHKANQGKWIAQTQLADELTYLVHGQEGLQLARRCSDLLFKGSIKELETLDPETIKGLFGAASTFSISKNSLDTVGQLAEMTRPGGAKLMKQGALRINGVRYQDPEQRLALDQLIIHNHFTIVCWGKRKFSLVLWN